MSRRSGGGSLSPPVPSSTRRNGEQEIRWPSSGSPSPHLWPAQGAVRGDPRAHEGWRSGGLLIAAPSWPLAAAARASLAAAARASLAAAAPSRAARTSELLGYGLYATQGPGGASLANKGSRSSVSHLRASSSPNYLCTPDHEAEARSDIYYSVLPEQE